MQNLSLHPKPTNTESAILTEVSGGLCLLTKFEKHDPRPSQTGTSESPALRPISTDSYLYSIPIPIL